MEIKNRELINTSTDWVSPSLIEEVLDADNVNDWINLDNVLDWESKDYAFIEKGVRKNVSSRPFKCSNFNFNIEQEEYILNNIEFRILVINDTQGGTNIKDNVAKISENECRLNETFWKEDDLEIRTFTLSYFNVDSLEDIEFEYSCIGTGTDYQIPQIYGIQCRILYSYYRDIKVEDTPQYEIKAFLDSYELIGNKTYTTLTINRFTLNGMSGLFGNLYIDLSNNLKFNDNTSKKIIKAVNTNNIWSSTDKFSIHGIKQGLGKITIYGSSIPNPIILYLNIDNEKYYNENLTVLENNMFNLCQAENLGGAIYNNSYLNNINPYYNENTANEGKNIYDALTIINTSLQDEYECGIVNFSCEISFQNQASTVNYGYVILYDNGAEIDSAEVNNQGQAIFNHNFETIGTHNLKMQYINKDFSTDTVDHKYGNSYIRKTIEITKKNAKLYLLDNEGNEVYDNYIQDIQQNSHMHVRLIDKTTLEPLVGQTILWNDKKYITDDEGIAYLMVMEDIGNLDIEIKYNGNDIYRETTLNRTINVTLKNIQIVSNDLYTRENVSDNYTVKLLNGAGVPLINKELYIYMENTIDEEGIKDYKYLTSSSGSISIPIKLHKGIWVTTNYFKSDGEFKSLTTYNNIICYDEGYTETKITLNETTLKGVPSDVITISGNLSDVIAQSGLKRDLQVIAINKTNNTKTYKQFKSNIYGDFSIDLNLSIGEYIFQVVFLGDVAYDGCLESGNITIYKTGEEDCIIQSADYKGKYSFIQDFKVYLTDGDSNPLSNRKIVFNFKKSNKDWFDYITYTDEKGMAKYPLGKLDFGTYLVKTSFLGDINYKGVTNKNIVVITYGNDIVDSSIKIQSVTEVNNNSRITFVLSDKTDNRVLDNQYCNIVTYNQEGYIDNIKSVTNDNGGFYIDLIKEPQLTVVEGIYPGSNIYKDYQYLYVYYEPKKVGDITSIEGNDVELFEGENKYYTTILKDENNEIIKNQYICTEIIYSDKSREISYNITDELGKINIELSKFKPDIYTFRSYYGGNSKYRSCCCENTIKINQNDNKIPTVIVGGDKTYNYTEVESIANSRYEIELTAGILGELSSITRSIPLKNKNITFLIENLDTNIKNTYTTITNSEGKAFISIKDWVGRFKITYTFLGDSEYAQSEESSILIINASEELPSIIEAYDTEVKYGETKNINIRLMSTLPTDISIDDEGIPISNASVEIHFINRITQEEYVINDESYYAQITNSQGRIKFGLLTDNNGEIDENKQKFFKTGLYDVIIKFLGTNIYKPCTKTVILNILEKDNLEKVYLTPINKKVEIDNIGNETFEELINISSIKMSVNDSSILIVQLESQAINGRPKIYNDNGDILYEIEGDYILLDFYDRANKKISYTAEIKEEMLQYDNSLHSIIEFDCSILEGGIYDCYISYPTQTYWKQAEDLRIQIEVIPKTPTLVLLNNENKPVDSLSFRYTSNNYIKVGLFYEDKFSEDTIILGGRELNIKWLNNEYIYFVYNGISYSAITGVGDLENNNEGIDGVAQLFLRRIEGLNIGNNEISAYNLITNNVQSNVLNFNIEISAEDNAYLSGIDFTGSSDASIIYYGLSKYNYNHISKKNIMYLNLYYEEYIRGGEETRQIPIENVNVSLKYWYYDNLNNKNQFVDSKISNADGEITFEVKIPSINSVILTDKNENPTENGEHYVFLEFTVNSDLYLNSDGNKIIKKGYLRLRKRNIIFNSDDYSYNEPIISFTFEDSKYSQDSEKSGDLVIDIDKI